MTTGSEVSHKPRRSPLTPTRLAGTIVAGLLILLSFVASFLAQCVVYVVTYPFLSKYRHLDMVGRTFRFVSRLFVVDLNPLWSLKVVRKPKGFENTSGKIIMCNHLSNADPFILCSALLPVETKYVAKGSLFKVPFGGWAMWMAGDLPVHFTKDKGGWGTAKGSVSKMMDQAKTLLKNGCNLAVFPEGARSHTGEMGEFKDGFFTLAVETGADVVPVALSGSQKCWPKGQALLDFATCQVAVGDTITTAGHTVPTLKDVVRKSIADMLVDLPPTVVPGRHEPKASSTPPKASSTPPKEQVTAPSPSAAN